MFDKFITAMVNKKKINQNRKRISYYFPQGVCESRLSHHTALHTRRSADPSTSTSLAKYHQQRSSKTNDQKSLFRSDLLIKITSNFPQWTIDNQNCHLRSLAPILRFLPPVFRQKFLFSTRNWSETWRLFVKLGDDIFGSFRKVIELFFSYFHQSESADFRK